MNRWSQSRRDLIKKLGLGAAVLPMLHATRPLRAATAFPRRLIVVIQTNGLPINIWRNVSTTNNLSGATLPEPFTPLDPWKSDLIMLPELSNPGYQGAGHGAYGTTFSGGPNNPAPEYWTPGQATIDQVCGEAAAKAANLPMKTLPLQVISDQGESRLGAYRCFYSGNNQAVTPEGSPYKVADRLFAGKTPGTDPALDKLRAERKSMLDFVKGDLDRFSKTLGMEDRQSIENHLTSVREIEKQLSTPPGGGAAGTCTSPNLGQPISVTAHASYPTLLGLQLDLAVAALRCDTTRVATVQLGNAFGGGLVFSWLGIQGQGLEYGTRSWHDVAHRELRGTINDKVAVDKWFMTQFAGLLDRLKKSPEGGGSMLDNTTVLWANHMENGANHNASRLPWILGGKGGGYFKTNQLLKPSPQISKTRVMCELANMMGANIPFFGSADHGGPLPEIRA